MRACTQFAYILSVGVVLMEMPSAGSILLIGDSGVTLFLWRCVCVFFDCAFFNFIFVFERCFFSFFFLNLVGQLSSPPTRLR